MEEKFSAADSEPIPVETGNGLTVSYRGRFLYSRRYPGKNPEAAAERLEILPGTLILLVSPVMDYGIRHLTARLPENSFVLAVEHDRNLFNFFIKNHTENHPLFKPVYAASPHEVIRFIDEHIMGKVCSFRRCMRVDFSAGGILHPEFYKQTEILISEYISTFWKNRITLIKLGRNYARNIFRNCADLCKRSCSFNGKNIRKAVIVAGAGPSLDSFLPFIKKNRLSVFLIAVDAALPSLQAASIIPDAAVTVESQIWINGAFCGAGKNIPVFADLSSRPGERGGANHVCFFFTPYTNASFLKRLRGLKAVDFEVPPLGSVGLSALFIAGKIKAMGRENLPVFFTGLDFSWGKGFSHSKGSFQIRDLFSRTNRLSTHEQKRGETFCSAAAWKNREFYTTPSMAGYAEQCAARFSNAGFFRLGNTGLPADFPSIGEEDAEKIIKAFSGGGGNRQAPAESLFSEAADKREIMSFLTGEKTRLEEIRGILTGETKDEKEKERLLPLIQEADYLYIHFPDFSGKVSLRPDFLNRVRIELEFFLKTINIAVRNCGTE